MFANDRKKFFRNLGREQALVEKPPKKEHQLCVHNQAIIIIELIITISKFSNLIVHRQP